MCPVPPLEFKLKTPQHAGELHRRPPAAAEFQIARAWAFYSVPRLQPRMRLNYIAGP